MSDRASDVTEDQIEHILNTRSKKIHSITQSLDALKRIRSAIQNSAFSDDERHAIDHTYETLRLQQADEEELLQHDTLLSTQRIREIKQQLATRTSTLDAFVSAQNITDDVMQYLQLFCVEQTRLQNELEEYKRTISHSVEDTTPQ